MRRRTTLLICGLLAASIVIVACLMLLSAGQDPRTAKPPTLAMHDVAMPEMAVAEPARIASPAMAVPPPGEAMAPPDNGVPATQAISVNVPQLAYTYMLGYRMPGTAIADAQQAHLALCTRLGPSRCQLVSMQRSSNEQGNANANLKLRVASGIAQSFSAELGKAVSSAGGRAADTSVTADDVSKDVVDTDARIRQREILVARLTDMLRNRQGRVSELVEAERSVAQAQEELDQAKGWLGELRGRIAFSDFTINYVPVSTVAPSPRTFAGQLGDAVAQSGIAVIAVVRTLLLIAIFLLPWLALATPVVLFLLARQKRHPAEPAEA
ncbi:DUF4349 domain-containing protein [Sphingomonas sp. JC676]|uniref:DUF4349 domain-containing protein n=1 Tax=Sphingomonas sp. JC676 TaxID=2768065 RepID=UPI001657A84B|nr:DUF4349 domain-containing protein [Sphingomonas sp. JC676]MBC9032210.1 DUF4349 domain-containing protein [Sphingomonas sp. JC676]